MAFIWTDTNIRHLSEMWAKGMTAAKIAEALGCTRNAAIGKSRRIGLTGRPSPIKATGSGARPREKRYVAPRPEPKFVRPAQEPLPLPVLPRPRALPAVTWAGEPVTQEAIGSHQCHWIVGNERGGALASMCGAPVERPGNPYCEGHRKRAWVGFKVALGSMAA